MSNRYLPTALRRALETAVKEARIVAEEGARDAIRRLGVADGKAPSYLNNPEKDLRRRLRAHARTMGDTFNRNDNAQETRRLVEAAAYAHWHRMLFARFLAERGLLRNPEHDVAVTLEDCRELAEAEGLTDAWAIAERYAAAMLPAVFRIDDPVLALDLDPIHTQKLHKSVTGLDAEVFQAEDSLGWTYQFWRAAEKDAVNKAGVKIGADELPAVTQLFTEPYMVRFLLHNALGAWWAGKVLAANPKLATTVTDEDEIRSACALPSYSFDMLRFVRKDQGSPWQPAAGTFSGWPKDAKAITMLDPCCGSGHFLTEAMSILAALRQAEEGLSPTDATAAVLRDNLHGLEIDGRCVQIAAFAVALASWRIGGWQTLPLPHIAWVGAPPPLPKREFLALAEGDLELEYALTALHELFEQAPILGSLLEPSGGDLFETEKMQEIERLLERLLDKTRRVEPEREEGVVAARGMSDAASILHRKFTIQATNVPYLGRGKQNHSLATYIEKRFNDARTDLATAMLERMRRLAAVGGSVCAVSPQNWLFLGSYKKMRIGMLTKAQFNVVADLGPAAFNEMNWWAARTALSVVTETSPDTHNEYLAVNADTGRALQAKVELLKNCEIKLLSQSSQIQNPDHRISVHAAHSGDLLSKYANVFVGFQNGDTPRWVQQFWEHASGGNAWAYFQLTSEHTTYFDGRDAAIKWDGGNGDLVASEQAFVKGKEAWGKRGVIVRQMRHLPAGLYFGDLYDQSNSVIVSHNDRDLPAIACFVMSEGFHDAVRKIDPSVAVTNATFVKVPFDVEYWRTIAAAKYPSGLPEPASDDVTQWLFHGHPADVRKGCALHAVLARLCGYRWPAEVDPDMLLSGKAREWIAKAAILPAGDSDGLLGVPAVAGEKPLADRVRGYLASTFGAEWSDTLERRLVAEADELLDKKAPRDTSLDAWLRNRAFRQHCALFGQRPFLWHISDGLKDGFSVFVHYHRFNQANLRKLTYTMLGDWLARTKAENNTLRYEKGRELQQMLEKVLEGERPYDIFVRWKSLAHQSLGWEPDLDDGVRQNIRPFIKAGVLTHDLSKILKDKDRGADVASAPWHSVFKGERRNDHHTTLAEKRAAREATAKRAKAPK